MRFNGVRAMPTLHNMQMSGNCYKVRLVAHKLGIPLALKDYPVNGTLTRQPEFLSKNPNGRVPLLEFEDGRTLAESNAIIWHLSEGTDLQPADNWGRAQALQRMFFEQYSHEPYIAVLRFLRTYAPKDSADPRLGRIAELEQRGHAALAVMETHLGRHAWFAGGRFSVADIALYAYTHVAGEGGFELARYPAVSAWLDRTAAQPRHIPL